MSDRADKYQFYGWKEAENICLPDDSDSIIKTPADLYDRLCDIWCRETCAPRIRAGWTPENKTSGQCSITSFLVQDLFGGKVYGVPRPGGTFHCYNEVDGIVFDLTSEQFGDEKLCYENNPVQSRAEHFQKEEKYQRYLLLKDKLAASLH